MEARGVRRELLVAAAISLVLTVALLVFTDLRVPGHPDYSDPVDHKKYIYLATHDPFSFHLAPFGWRILGPLLARALPFDLQTSFLVITFVSLWLTGAMVYLLGRQFHFSPTLALAGMLLFFSMGWATKWNMHDFWRPDALAFLFLTLAISAALARRDAWLTALLFVGVLVKETVFFAAPLRYSLHARRVFDRAAILRAVLLALPALAVLVILRIAIPPLNDDPAYVATLPRWVFADPPYGDGLTYDLIDRAAWVIRYRIRTFDGSQLYALTLAPWGLLAGGLALAGGRRGLQLALRFLPLLALGYLGLLWAPVDTPRVLVAAFPAVLFPALAGARALSERFGTAEWRFVAAPAVLFAYLLRVPYATVPLSRQLIIAGLSVPFLLNLDRQLRRGPDAATPTRSLPAASTTRRTPPG